MASKFNLNQQKVGVEICEALGLDPDKVYSLSLHLRVNQMAVVEVGYRPDEEIQGIVPALRHYKLVSLEV